MATHWVPPPPGILKINVHGSSRFPSAHDYRTGIGAIYRDSEGALKHVTLEVIAELSPLGNQLRAVFVALKRAFKFGHRDIILETDNYEAFSVIKNFNIGAPVGVYDIASQIDIRLKDKRWFCMVAYVVPARNGVARFLARLGKKSCESLYTLNRPVGGVEELLDWDMGMGLDDPNYEDIVIPDGAPDPEDFDVGVLLSDQTDELGLGQVDATRSVNLDVGMDADNNLEEVMMEEAFQGGIAAVDGFFFSGDMLPVEMA